MGIVEAKNYHSLIQKTIAFMRHEIQNRGFQKVILGLSGGIDSAVVAALASLALMEQNSPMPAYLPIEQVKEALHCPILCVIMPASSSDSSHIEDAKEVARCFKLPHTIAPLNGFEDSLKSLHPDIQQSNPLRMGNACARFRMTLLYDLAFTQNRIVLGTTNKSERMLGYGTIFGDLASGLNPIGNLYKSDIFILAQHLGIPSHIINKPPSADLYQGQTDEKELGYTYAQIDAILYDFIDLGHDRQTLIRTHDSNAVDMVLKRYHATCFKRESIPIAEGF